MAKRAGRNTKRKLRERIKQLEDAQLSSERSIDRYAGYKTMYEELVSSFKRWWDYTILIDPPVIAVDELPPFYKVPFTQELSTTEIHCQTLEAIRVLVRHDYVPEAIHIMLRTPLGDVGYYISRETFMQYKKMPQAMVDYITASLVNEFDKNFDYSE